MTLDRGKLAVWVLVLTALAGGIVLRYEHKPHPVPVPAPVVVQEPAPAPLPPEPAPVVQQAPLPDPAPVTHPTSVKPVPVPLPRPKSKPVHKKPAVKKANPCAKVPAAAYAHDKDTVISFAKARGVSDVDMAILKACIGA